jgi:hypothetical protein
MAATRQPDFIANVLLLILCQSRLILPAIARVLRTVRKPSHPLMGENVVGKAFSV